MTTEKQLMEPALSDKKSGKRGRKKGFKLPNKPAVPVRALWDWATPEQREKAHQSAAVLMEYWMGRVSKGEVATRLSVPQLRVWQLSQAAISGMVAGLLTQPKTRAKGAPPMNPEEDPKKLQKKIAELQKHIAMQDRLISVLREMPGCRDASIPMEETLVGSLTTRKEPPVHATTPAKKAALPQKSKTPVPTGARSESRSNPSGGRSGDKA